MDIKTIDQRIRERAVAEYAQTIDAWIKATDRQFFESSSSGPPTSIQNPARGGQPFYVEELLLECRRAFLARYADTRGEEAVQRFLTKLDSLGDEVEELRNSVNH